MDYMELPAAPPEVNSSGSNGTTPFDDRNQKHSLPFPLLFLFALNGIILELPMLAFTAIVNDVVEMPMSLLSAYGAVTFMPSSFRPLYSFVTNAVVVHGGDCRSSDEDGDRSSSTLGRCQIEMHVFIAFLLILSGMSTFGTSILLLFSNDGGAAENKIGVVLCFVFAFVRGVCVAFPEFLLGLTLVNQARIHAHTRTHSHHVNDHNNGHERKDSDIDGNSSNYSVVFEYFASLFQGQAATARNIGSLFASMVTIVTYFKMRGEVNNDGHLSHKEISTILFLSGMVPLIGAIVAFITKIGTRCISNTEFPNPIQSTDSSTELITYEKIDNCDQEQRDLNAGTFLVMKNNDDQRLMYKVDDDDIHENDDAKSGGENSSYCHAHITGGFTSNDKIFMALLQIMLIWIGMQYFFHENRYLERMWQVVIGVLTVVLGRYSWIIFNKSSSSLFRKARGPILYLILRNAIPNMEWQWSSYTYSILGSKPAMMQTLSIIGSVAMTLGSIVYTKYLSRWPISRIIVVTTISGSLVQLFHLSMVNCWKDPESNINYFFTMSVLTNMIGGIIGEVWFIPMIVIATSSLQSVGREKNLGNNYVKEELVSRSTLFDDNVEILSKNERASIDDGKQSMVDNFQYGTFISCIDFGAQIGAWINVPFIAMFGLSRDNWGTLSYLIIVSACLNFFSLVFLKLLSKA